MVTFSAIVKFELTVFICQCHKQCTSLLFVKMSYRLDLRKTVESLSGRMTSGEIINALQDENISRATIFRVLKDCREGKKQENKKKSGRPSLLSATATKRLVESVNNKVGVSQRQLARKFEVSQPTVHRILKKRGVQKRKRKHAPKYTEKQLQNIPKCCRALRTKHFSKEKFIVIDDEKYFTLANHTMSGNDIFYTDNIQTAPESVKFAAKAKFEHKVLVWIAISLKGISQPYIHTSRAQAVNSDVYINKCLTKLKDFIEKYHNQDEIIFWPDLASCHYAKKTLDWLNEKNIKFVPQKDNPPNVPQARPIENFWAVLTRLVYNKGWEAKNLPQLIGRIKRKLKEVDQSVIQRMMNNIGKVLRKIEDEGPLAAV